MGGVEEPDPENVDALRVRPLRHVVAKRSRFET